MESSLYVERAAGLGWRRHPRYRVRGGPAQREGDPQDRSCCRRRARLHLRDSRKDGEDQKHELSPATESYLRCQKCHWRPISLRWSPTYDFPSIDFGQAEVYNNQAMGAKSLCNCATTPSRLP